MDRLTPEKRSWNMSRIGRKDTRPEKIVRSLLHRLGFRFRLHRRDLPGTPDIVLPCHKTVIFIHGCFWHCHEGCKDSGIPKTNTKFWQEKLNKNMERDKKNSKNLKSLGWNVVKIWECETKDLDTLTQRINFELTHREE
jgi:DNA mismatch endonuclease (patch repair protein)